MDKLFKMIFMHIVTTIVVLSISRAVEQEDKFYEDFQISISDDHRNKREVDGEDVINRFEIERVSPLYDIIRHLPPFDDDWIPNPVVGLDFSPLTTKEFKNKSSKYDEFKIEVSKDEEHVVSKNGRQFQENTALNWYYSAESFTNENNNNTNTYQTPHTYIFQSPRSFTTRKLDEEHVISHIPSLKGGHGTFIDFSLLPSSTIPNVDVASSSTVEDPKPKVETRYILLQSGRIVTINVTSIPPVLKPNSSGSSSKNPNLPTFYFGSRIRNKNSTKLSNSTNVKQETANTINPKNVEVTTRFNTNFFIKPSINQNSDIDVTTIKPQTTSKSTLENISRKTPSKITTAKTTTIKPQVTRIKLQNSLEATSSTKSPQLFSLKPEVTHSKSENLKKATELTKSSTPTTTTKFTLQNFKEVTSPSKAPLQIIKDKSSLDDVERWWREMKAAKQERKTTLYTTLKPKITTKSHRNIFDKLIGVFLPSTAINPFVPQTLNSNKHNSDNDRAYPTTEPTTSFKIDRHQIPNTNAASVFGILKNDKEPAKLEPTVSNKKQSKVWTTTTAASKTKARNTNSTISEKVILETPAPLSEIRHDFVRIMLHPPILSTTEATVSTTPISSRRPRYRGLSHVNLQAPKQTTTDSHASSTKKPITSQQFQLTSDALKIRQQNRQQSLIQSTTESPRKQSFQIADPPISPSPPRQSRHGFFLRNSFSFQTIPPGSLTDRRSLTRNTSLFENSTIENVPPPIEDLLIISFEPTRKSIWTRFTEDVTEKSPAYEPKPRNFRTPLKKFAPASALPRKQDVVSNTSPKPSRKFTYKPVEDTSSKDESVSKSNGGNRVGRHFRHNTSRQLSVIRNEESTSPSPNTKQPFRLFYFEPKREKVKSLEVTQKNETSKRSSVISSKRDNTNTGRLQHTAQRGQTIDRGNVRHGGIAETPNSRRQPKQLSVTPRNLRTSTEAITTPKSVGKKLRSSPFIWHRPNVGTDKSVTPESLLEVPVREQSDQKQNIRNTYDDGYYRPAKAQRTG